MTDAELAVLRKLARDYEAPVLLKVLDYIDFLRLLIHDLKEESSAYERGRQDERACWPWMNNLGPPTEITGTSFTVHDEG